MTSKAEYLKRYLSANDEKKKKKKRKPQSSSRMKIVDNEIEVDIPKNDKKKDEIGSDDDQPVLALTDDLRVDELKLMGKFKTDSWVSLENEKKSRHDSDSDDSDNDNSPPRRRHDSGSDNSVRLDSDESPSRNKSRDSDNDQSPPRKQTRHSADQSPPRKRARDSGNDQSPLRRRKDDDLSPVRRKIKKEKHSKSPERKTLDGKRAGLQSAKGMREEANVLKKKEDEIFENIDDLISGRNAGTVFRERSGKRRDFTKEKEKSEEEKKRQKELEEKYKVWNKGVKQLSNRQSKLEEMAKEVSKPFARYKDDEDLDEHLKSQLLRDDPMLDYIRKKKVSKQSKTGLVYPKYQGPGATPNRYAIEPGYRWDGVDRSNGFETKLMSQSNDRKAEQEEFYKWQMGNYE